MDNTQKLELLKEELKKKDWYYFFSDGMNTYSAGNDHHKQIMKMVNEIGQEAKDLYNQMAPSDQVRI